MENRQNLPFRKNCEGYFFNEHGKILALKSNIGFIIFPGGGIEEGETIEQGMLRETFEETGAKIKKLQHLNTTNLIWDQDWAKTEKQKQRYEKFQGDEMHFFTGEVESIEECDTEEDSWKQEKFMDLNEVIKEIENQVSTDSIPNEYRQLQLDILKSFNKSKEKLAILGGEKTITQEKPHYIWPEITKKTKEKVLEQLDKTISIYDKSGIIKEFEDRFAQIHNTKHALLTNSGTMGLYSLFVGADLKQGDEIICPAYTFHATITPIFMTGATPILADCKEHDWNIDPQDIKKKITPKTKAIIVTHMWGIPCDMDEITKIAKEHNLFLFEDCSHAHLSRYKGQYVGTFGDGAVFSLQGQKTITGGEGGVLITNNDEIFSRALVLGHYNKRLKNEISKDSPLYDYYLTGMGFKLRAHPLAIAIALEQLNSIEEKLEIRNQIAKKLTQELNKLPGIKVQEFNDKEPTWYALPIEYKPEELGNLPFEKFYQALQAEGCLELDHPGSTLPLNLTKLFQSPERLFPNYKNKLNYKQGDMPKAESLYNNTLKLPVWHKFEDMQLVDLYIKAFKKVIDNYKQLLTEDITTKSQEQRQDFFESLLNQAQKANIQKIVVGGVIVEENNKFLLLERPKDDFMGGINELPSGNLEQNESIEQGLIREVKEETNLDINQILKYLGHFDYKSGSGKNVRQFNFLVNVKSKDNIKLTEHDNFFWANKQDQAFNKVTDSVKQILSRI